MMAEFRKDIVTALVDGEIADPDLKQEVLSKIESDQDLEIDYKAQLLIKNLVKEKIAWKRTPDKVKGKILRMNGSTSKVESVNKQFLSNLFEKPAFSFATAFVVILAIVLILLNRTSIIEERDFAIEQIGSDNMFIQAQNNFNGIVSGKLSPQMTSDKSEQIKKFFTDNGVKYETSVPEIKNWKLLGAVVSEDKGEKFAHHLYINRDGKLAYLFQVDESYLNSHEIISLSDDLIKYLDEGNCYTIKSANSITLFTKVNNNIFSVVSDGNLKEVEQSFCSL
jgi:hypothetical protein